MFMRAGSSPVSPTKWLRSTEVVHFLGKEEVTGSNPVGASIGFSGFATYQVFAVVNMKMIE